MYSIDVETEDVKKLRAQFLEVLDGAIANLENGVEIGNAIKYSLAESYDSEFEKVLDTNNEYYKNNVFVLGKMPSLYGDFGIDTSLDLTITAKHIRDAVKGKNENGHALSKEIIKKAVISLNEPSVIIQGKKQQIGCCYKCD